MDNLNFNKIAAGVLCGGLLLMAGIKAGEILLPHQELEENAYPFEVAEASGDGDGSTLSEMLCVEQSTLYIDKFQWEAVRDSLELQTKLAQNNDQELL